MDEKKDWIITLPKAVEWSDYEREIAQVADGVANMLFRVPKFCKSPRSGDRCFITHRGFVRGWMSITGLVTMARGWQCSTTDRMWPAGRYLLRSGIFNPIEPREYKHFRGIRRFENRDQ